MIAQLGAGPEVARRRTGQLLGAFDRRAIDIEHVVVTGIAGGIDGVSPIGALFVPARVIDLTTGHSYVSSRLGSIEPAETIATSGRELITDAAVLAGLLARGIRALDMETAGVAAACREHGDIPWTAFRSVSDRPEDKIVDGAVASLLRDDGSADVLGGLKMMARHPGRIPGLMRAGRESTRAARIAAQATAAAIGSRSPDPAHAP